MSWDPLAFCVAAVGVFIAGVSKGGFGSGASFAAAPLLASFVPPSVALGVLLPVLMLIDAATLRPYWRKWHKQASLLLCLGAVPGVVIGALVFQASNPDAIRVLIGVIALAFLGFQIAKQQGWITGSDWEAPPSIGLFAGLVGGFTSFVSHAGGPPMTVYLLHKKITKTEFQATTVVVFWLINIAKLGPYTALGLVDGSLLVWAIALAPFALLGAWVGVRAHDIVPERLFFAVTYVLLGVAGIKLLLDGLF